MAFHIHFILPGFNLFGKFSSKVKCLLKVNMIRVNTVPDLFLKYNLFLTFLEII